MIRRIPPLGLVALVAMLLVASGCGGDDEDSAAQDSGGTQTVKVGYVNSLSGDYAVYGKPMTNGSQLAADKVNEDAEANGFRIELVVRDDRSDPKQSATVSQGFCDDSDNVAVLGFNSSTVLLAAIPIFNQCQMPIIAQGTTSPALSGSSPFFHRSIESDALTGVRIADQATVALGAKRLAVFNPNDDYGNGVAGVVIPQAEKNGAEIAYHFKYAGGTKDFRAAVTKVKGMDVDAILLLGYYADGAAIVEQARSIGVTAPFVASQSMRAPDFLKLAGGAAEGSYVASDYEPDASPAAKAFDEEYTAKYGSPPDSITSVSYEAVLLLADALKRANGDYSRTSINEAMKEVSIDGLWQPLSFDDKGDPDRQLIWLQVKDGEFVTVEQ